MMSTITVSRGSTPPSSLAFCNSSSGGVAPEPPKFYRVPQNGDAVCTLSEPAVDAPPTGEALLAGDGDMVADIYRQRVMRRAGRPQTWGWGKAYGEA